MSSSISAEVIVAPLDQRIVDPLMMLLQEMVLGGLPHSSLSEEPVLLAQKSDDVSLLAIHHAGKGQLQEPKRERSYES